MKDSSSSSIRLGGAVISDRIVSALLEELRTGRYADADRLPAEVDLAAQLSVSRTVIRDALSEMERAGYIERVRGIGTVINRTVLGLRSRLDQKLEYYPLIRSFGSYPHADGIQIYPIPGHARPRRGWDKSGCHRRGGSCQNCGSAGNIPAFDPTGCAG